MNVIGIIGCVVGVIGCLIGIAGWIGGGKRQVKTDTKEDVSTTTTMLVKLDFILQTLSEMKANSGVLEKDVREFRELQLKDHESLKSAWNVIKEQREEINDLRKELAELRTLFGKNKEG